MENKMGLIGLGVMGQNLALNLVSRGCLISVYDKEKDKTEKFLKIHAKKNIFPCFSLEELVKSIKRPRKIILLVPAGKAVDIVIEKLIPFLEKGDILIDGGNSFFKNTRRRNNYLISKGIFFIGAGISGGRKGALLGPSIMAGGNRKAYKLVEGILKKISARAEDGMPCSSYIGPVGAGHFVKMAHNGIEYAVMQIIGECVWALRNISGFSLESIAEVFKKWNNPSSDLESYLMSITSICLRQHDGEQGFLIDRIADIVEMKGTGTWAVKSGLELLVPVPTISSAVFSRIASMDKDKRIKISGKLKFKPKNINVDKKYFTSLAYRSLYISIICSYAQGFALISKASKNYTWNIDMASIAKIWRAGCIIRAKLLSLIAEEYEANPSLDNLIAGNNFKGYILKNINKLAEFIHISHNAGIPVPAISSAYNYIYQMSSPKLFSAQLNASQRHYFGAHRYYRFSNKNNEIENNRKL